MKNRTHWGIATLVFILALSVRLFYCYHLEKTDPYFYYFPKEADSAYLHDQAYEVIQGNFLNNDKPMYTTFLASIYWWADNDKYAVRIVQFFIGALQAALLCVIGIALFNLPTGIMSGLMAVFYGPFIYYEGKVLVDTFHVFLMTGLVTLIVCAHVRQRGLWYFLMGLVIGMMAVDRANIILFVPVYWVGLLLFGVRKNTLRMIIPVMSAAIVIPAAVLSLVLYLTTGSGEHKTNPLWEHLYRGNGFGASGMFMPIDRLEPVPDNNYLHATLRSIQEHPFSWLKLMARKTKFFLWYYELPNNYSYEFDKEHYPILRYGLQYGIILPCALMGIGMALRKNYSARWVVLIGTVYAASIITFFITARYRLPFVPVIIPFAAYFLTYVPGTIRRSSWRAKILYVSIFMGIVLFVNLPRYDTFHRTMRLGHHYREWKLYDKAERQYKRACRFDQHSSEPYVGLATLSFERRDMQRAYAYAYKARELEPEAVEPRLILAQVMMYEGHDERAAEELDFCLHQAPHDAQVYFHLGRLHVTRNEIREAQKAFEQSIALKGENPVVYVNLGAAYLVEAQYEKAERFFLEALAMQPMNFEAEYNLGILYYNVNRYMDSVRHFEKAYALNSAYPGIERKLAAARTAHEASE